MSTKIFYASRTHSQIKQLFSELKKTAYRPVCVSLGSRDHLCVNKTLKSYYGEEKNKMCGSMVTSCSCKYFKTVKEKRKKIVEVYSKQILDIEDLVS